MKLNDKRNLQNKLQHDEIIDADAIATVINHEIEKFPKIGHVLSAKSLITGWPVIGSFSE